MDNNEQGGDEVMEEDEVGAIDIEDIDENASEGEEDGEGEEEGEENNEGEFEAIDDGDEDLDVFDVDEQMLFDGFNVELYNQYAHDLVLVSCFFLHAFLFFFCKYYEFIIKTVVDMQNGKRIKSNKRSIISHARFV